MTKRRPSAAGARLRAALRPAHALRAACVAALAVAIGAGCFLDGSGRAPAESTYQCTATVRSPEGMMDMADSSLEPWSGTVCVAFGTDPTTEWRRRLFEVASGDPAVAPLGYACAEDVTCGGGMALPEGMTCPAPRSATPIPACGAAGEECLGLTTTDPSRIDAGFDLTLLFPPTAVGERSPTRSVTIANDGCGGPIRLSVAEALAGRDAALFRLDSSTCDPDPAMPDEVALGKSLDVGESCTVTFSFAPTEVMGFASANLGVSQDTVLSYRIRLYADEILP